MKWTGFLGFVLCVAFFCVYKLCIPVHLSADLLRCNYLVCPHGSLSPCAKGHVSLFYMASITFHQHPNGMEWLALTWQCHVTCGCRAKDLVMDWHCCVFDISDPHLSLHSHLFVHSWCPNSPLTPYISLFIMPKPQFVMSVVFPHVMSFPLFMTVALILWYNHTGWQGVKHQVAYLIFMTPPPPARPPALSWGTVTLQCFHDVFLPVCDVCPLSVVACSHWWGLWCDT